MVWRFLTVPLRARSLQILREWRLSTLEAWKIDSRGPQSERVLGILDSLGIALSSEIRDLFKVGAGVAFWALLQVHPDFLILGEAFAHSLDV